MRTHPEEQAVLSALTGLQKAPQLIVLAAEGFVGSCHPGHPPFEGPWSFVIPSEGLTPFNQLSLVQTNNC